MHIPTGYDDLTADWLTAALRAGDGSTTITVSTCQVEPLTDSFGFYGQLARVYLGYETAEMNAPPSLIAKLSSDDEAMRSRAGTRVAYAREVNFYRGLAGETDLRTPACYYSDIDAESGWHVLLLEDMAPARTGNRIDGCSREQAEMAVRRIAPFHAAWWENPRLEMLDWLADGPEPDPETVRERMAGIWVQFIGKAADRLSDPIRDIGESLIQQPDPLAVRRHVFGSSPRTLIHRDYKLDNIFFGTADDDVPFAVIDWQLITLGRGVWDVAYFLCENLPIELRRSVEMELLHMYHRLLVDGGVQGYPFELCLLDYRFSLLQRYTALITTIGAMPFSEEQLRFHVDILLPRNSAALLDHDAVELLNG